MLRFPLRNHEMKKQRKVIIINLYKEDTAVAVILTVDAYD